jgi:cytochrome c-type biogenesis protein CcmE
MTPTRRRRLLLITVVLAGVITSTTLVLRAFQENLLFFFSPSQVVAGEAPMERSFRLGGILQEGSIERESGSMTVNFVVTDFAHSVPVTYTGVLPALFIENQGVVARGRLDSSGGFVADEVLARHDENYMPVEVAEALERAGAQRPAGPYSQQPAE